MGDNSIKHNVVDKINNEQQVDAPILDFGKIEGQMPKMYSDIHQLRAENSVMLRNWLRNENFEIGHLKGFFKLNDNLGIFEQDLTVGFVAYLFNMENEFLNYEQWVNTDVMMVGADSKLYRYINILVGCGRYELSKADNFFIHEWEGNEWYQEWVGYEVDWKDWIKGPKMLVK